MSSSLRALFILPALFLSACTTAPMYVRFDNGHFMQGSGLNGKYTFEDLDGLKCTGSYPILFIKTTHDIPVTCSDGRTGHMLLTLNDQEMNTGHGMGRLSDGSEFEVYLGDVKNGMSVPSFFKKPKM